MDTLKISQSHKEFNLLLTPRTHHSKNLEASTKILSYPSYKLNKENSGMLSRKLLEEVKTLQKENKELKELIASLKEDKQDLLERCRQY
jgi:cell division protein FtsB